MNYHLYRGFGEVINGNDKIVVCCSPSSYYYGTVYCFKNVFELIIQLYVWFFIYDDQNIRLMIFSTFAALGFFNSFSLIVSKNFFVLRESNDL